MNDSTIHTTTGTASRMLMAVRSSADKPKRALRRVRAPSAIGSMKSQHVAVGT